MVLLDDPRLVSAKQKDFFEDILEDRRHTSDVKWAMRTRDEPQYKYNKPRTPPQIKDQVLKSDRVKYAAEKVLTLYMYMYISFNLFLLKVLFL